MAGDSTGWRSKLGSSAVVAGGFAALSSWWIPSGVLLAVGLLLIWSAPGWWRHLIYGALGGLIAGALVLAPGFRLAMRVVALVDPRRTPGLTMDGTLVILLTVGGLVGVAFGVLGGIARFGWSLSDRYSWAVPTGLVMVLLLLNDDLRGELFELGEGSWMNIPMFTLVAAAYGWVAMKVVARLDSRRRAKVPAPPVPAGQGVAG